MASSVRVLLIHTLPYVLINGVVVDHNRLVKVLKFSKRNAVNGQHMITSSRHTPRVPLVPLHDRSVAGRRPHCHHQRRKNAEPPAWQGNRASLRASDSNINLQWVYGQRLLSSGKTHGVTHRQPGNRSDTRRRRTQLRCRHRTSRPSYGDLLIAIELIAVVVHLNVNAQLLCCGISALNIAVTKADNGGHRLIAEAAW